MRVYIATPINGRHDGRDFNEKLTFAKHRVGVLKQVLRDEPAFKGCEFVSTFDIHHGTMPSEAKAMGDCNTVKPVGDFITDGKQYKVCNECRAHHTKRQELGQKPKSPHGTGERCEYHRQYYQENKEKIKAKRCESSGTPSAVTTDKRIVMLFEKGYSPNDIASRCMVGVERVKHVIEREGCRAGEARLCCDCWLYPCFDGMDSISTNLAMTCQKYHRKEAAS